MTSAAMSLDDHQALASGSRRSVSRLMSAPMLTGHSAAIPALALSRNDNSSTLESAPNRSVRADAPARS